MVMRSINCGFLPFCIIYRHYLYHEICLTSPQNSKITSNKFSSVEKTMNSCFLAYLALLLLEVIITLMMIITLVLVNHENMRNWKRCPFTSKTLARTLVLPFLTHLEHSQAIAKSKLLPHIHFEWKWILFRSLWPPPWSSSTGWTSAMIQSNLRSRLWCRLTIFTFKRNGSPCPLVPWRVSPSHCWLRFCRRHKLPRPL